MKRTVLLFVFAILAVLFAAQSASAAELDIHLADQWGAPINSYIASQVLIAVAVWDNSTTRQKPVGEYTCKDKQQSSWQVTQGCFDSNGDTVIMTDASGADLATRALYLIKINAPGYRQAKAEWVYMDENGFTQTFLRLEPSPVQMYSSYYMDSNGTTQVWHYLFSSSQDILRLRLETEGRYAGITSKELTAHGTTTYANLLPQGWAVIYERWKMPSWQNGQSYGEENCVRSQATDRRTGEVLGEGELCMPNSIR